jgi:hypothetical protein
LILHIYHCTLAIFHDYRTSGGRNRPAGTGKWPPKAGEADVHFLPPTNDFGDRDLGRLLSLFQSVDLDESEWESPVLVNWDFLQQKLGLPREAVTGLVAKARQLGLMERLTIDYNHERWLRHSRTKGCVVVMTCVEPADLERDPREIADAYCDAVDRLVREEPPRGLLSAGQDLREVFVIPNGHLDVGSRTGLYWGDVLPILQGLPPALAARGYEAHLNSYGYEKLIRLAINAHKMGYVLRVI